MNEKKTHIQIEPTTISDDWVTHPVSFHLFRTHAQHIDLDTQCEHIVICSPICCEYTQRVYLV